jgi:hypothetical protein
MKRHPVFAIVHVSKWAFEASYVPPVRSRRRDDAIRGTARSGDDEIA